MITVSQNIIISAPPGPKSGFVDGPIQTQEFWCNLSNVRNIRMRPIDGSGTNVSLGAKYEVLVSLVGKLA